MHTYDGREIWCKVLSAHHPVSGYLPSARYMRLLREGAIENKIDKSYIEFLTEFPTFNPNFFHKVLAFISLLFALPFMLIALIPSILIFRSRYTGVLWRIVFYSMLIFNALCCCSCVRAKTPQPVFQPHPV